MASLFNCRRGALAAIKGDSSLGIPDQAIVIANRGEGASPTRFERILMDKSFRGTQRVMEFQQVFAGQE